MRQSPVEDTRIKFRYWIMWTQQALGRAHPMLSVLVLLLVCYLFVGRVQSQTDVESVHPWASAPRRAESPWWQGLNIFRGGLKAPEMEKLVNVVGWGNNAETEIQQQSTWRKAGRLHTGGGRYVGSLSATSAASDTYMERPELATAAVIDIYGEPLVNPVVPAGEVPLWLGNTNHPLWQAFLLEQARALVDADVDGILIDTIEGTSGSILDGGSFGEPDMSGFRAYLAVIYTPQELLDLYDITDIQTFDYGYYIRDRGLADTWMSTPWLVPLYGDFVRFQQLAIVEFMTKLIGETRAYAETTYGRPVAFTANVFGLYASELIFADLLDYFTLEYPYVDYGYPPEGRTIPDYKLARALGDKPAVMLPSIHTAADLVNRESSSTLMTIYIAEAYASLGAMMVPYGIYGYSEEVGPTWYYGDMPVLAPVYGFVRDNPYLYEGLDSLAKAAILYSFPTDYHRWAWYRDALRGLSYALLDGQVQFDIVALGDNVWSVDSFSLAKLTPYQIVFLPGAAYLSNAQVDSLLSFVAGGGTLVAWGDTGIYDETGQETGRPELAALTVPGTHAYGEGWFITLTGDPGESYLQTHDPTVRHQLVSLVSGYADSVTAASAGPTLNLLAYERRDGSQAVVHLINYDYAIETDQVQPTGSFTLTLRPPAGFLEQDEIQLYLLSPHRAEPSLLDFAVDDGLLVIDHPSVEIYDVQVILAQSDALALANETLDILKSSIAEANNEGYDTSSLDDLLVQVENATAAGNHLLARQLGQEALELLHVLTRPRVLFDEAHDERNTLSWERALTIEPEHPDWVYFGALAAALDNEFILERNPDAPLSLELLQDYDALILSAPGETLSAVELEAVRQFAVTGGGLLVLADWCTVESVNSLTSAYDMIFVPGVISPGQDFVVSAFSDHQAVKGVPFMVPEGAASLAVGGSAVALAFTPEDVWQDTNSNWVYDAGEPTGPFTIAAAHEVGRARVAAVSDNAFQDNGFEWLSNDIFMRSLLKWVTHWHPPYTNHVHLPIVLRGGAR